MTENENLRVAVRVRPFNEREKRRKAKCVISMNENTTTITNPTNGDTKEFTFDYSYWSHDGFVELEDGQLQLESPSSNYADQESVFADLGKGVLQNAWDGYNATLFAYGQTGSGKSYSMIGHGANKGIVPITCGHLFNEIDKIERKKKELQVTFSMLEIYNEQIRDLLNSKAQEKRKNLKVREGNKIGFYVEGLSSHPCQNYKTIEYLMEKGAVTRTTASTNMNSTSSRSHMVICIKFKQIFRNATGVSTTKASEINLVDLAGSERANSTGATGDRLKEGSAINKSLLMLGTVIEKLAAGNSKVVIPYRDSTLTKLLKSALGGNSKTVMIAALSPADINYDETLSTLRYADRAKKIKNRAVINESSTDRLIRELKTENAKLLALLTKTSSNNLLDSEEVKRLIAQNERQMKEMTMTWEQKLEAARKQWEKEKKMFDSKNENLNTHHPYLQNVNEDPQLSGIVKHVLCDGTTIIGKSVQKNSNIQNSIVIKSLGIQKQHCVITCSSSNNDVILEPFEQSAVTINGLQILVQTKLKHGDRLKLGSNALFLYFGFLDERGSSQDSQELAKRFDYEFFQNEFYSASGVTRDIKNPERDPIQHIDNDPVFLEYIELMPVVACLNAMSEEMGKMIVFSLLVKNLTTCDAYGKEMKKEVMVQLRHQVTYQVWMWNKSKFENRRFMIEEIYMKFLDDPSTLTHLSKDKDPFWDPVEDIYLGCAHVWLHSLAYCMSCKEKVTFNNHSGGEEGSVVVSLSPCSEDGRTIDDEDMIVVDPNALLGKQYDVIIEVKGCQNVSWVKMNSTRGLMLRYNFYNERFVDRCCTKWHSVSPTTNWREKFTVEIVDPTFLHYLHSAALVLELWGLQEGNDQSNYLPRDKVVFKPTSVPASSSSTPSTSSENSSVDILEEELTKAKLQLNILDEGNKELRKICTVLKKENAQLKLKNQSRASRRAATAYTRHRECVTSPLDDKFVSANKVQAEMGRALKSFFAEVKDVQNDLRNISSSESQSENLQVLEISQKLDQLLIGLKGRVTTAIRNHKNEKKSSSNKNLTR